MGKYKRVIRLGHDAADPVTGAVVGREDEDRVLVVWGDAAFGPEEHLDEARVEFHDELMPVR